MRTLRTITDTNVDYSMIASEDVGEYNQLVAVQPVKGNEQGELLVDGKSGKHLSDLLSYEP